MPLTISALGEGLHEALVPQFDKRVMVLELGDGLAVPQAPGDTWTGEALVDAMSEAFPTRSVRWVVPTHHHSDSMSAVRAFVAASAL